MERMSLEEFSQKLSEKVPVPGGGGAAALTGALGAALGRMAAAYTSGKKRYEQHEARIQAEMQRLEDLRVQLMAGIREDADAFLPLSVAYALPANTDAERKAKRSALQKALCGAIDAPMKTLQRCSGIVDALLALGPITSPLMKSDIGCAASLCKASMESALLNVLINTQSLEDKPKAAEISSQAQHICQNGMRSCQIIYEAVLSSLCNEN